MSVRVLNEVFDHSRSSGHDLCVLIALADAAHHDGVTWLPVEAEPPTRSIMSRAHCSRETAFRSIKRLRLADELRVTQVRRGSSTINVYRVVVGSIAESDVDRSRIPFELPDDAFQGVSLTPSTSERNGTAERDRDNAEAQVHGVSETPSTVEGPQCQPDASQGVSDTDSRVSAGPDSGCQPDPATPHGSDGSAPEPSGEPSGEAAAEPSEDLKRGSSTAAAEPSEDPASDAEIRQLVGTLRGADADSARVILPLAAELPRSIFVAAFETVEQRRPDNPCGLLTHLLQVALRAHHAAMRTVAADAEAVPETTTIDRVRSEDPGAYIETVLAPAFADDPAGFEQILETYLADFVADEDERHVLRDRGRACREAIAA